MFILFDEVDRGLGREKNILETFFLKKTVADGLN